ncbi:heparan-alpha-glucosaminide N-acetyltransferase domain-containing protein [Saccharopolyspora rosea]
MAYSGNLTWESVRGPTIDDRRGTYFGTVIPPNENPTVVLPRPADEAPPRRSRLRGVDLARALAVFGMFVAHIGPNMINPHSGGAAKVLADLSEGHSSILFATLAGVSLALLTGGSRPHEGVALRRDRIRIAVRAALLFVLGMALTQLGAPIMVILSFYGVYFLLALPLLRLRPGALLATAAVWALVAPQLSFVLRQPMDADSGGGALSFSDLTSLSGAGTGLLNLLLTGTYPVLTWMPFVLTGLALGRCDLRSTAVRVRLFAGGVGLAVLGYGSSWLALNVFGGLRSLEPILNAMRPLAAQYGVAPLDLLTMHGFGTVPTSNAALLLLASAHTGTTFEIVGSTGCALAVLALCLVVGDRVRALLAPLAAVGSMALTVYVVQAVALKIIEDNARESLVQLPWLPLTGLVVGSLVLCGLWRPFLGRGPLEWLLHRTSTRTADALGSRL